jgi:hypothetical protein
MRLQIAPGVAGGSIGRQPVTDIDPEGVFEGYAGEFCRGMESEDETIPRCRQRSRQPVAWFSRMVAGPPSIDWISSLRKTVP